MNAHKVTLFAPNKKEQYEENVEDVFEFYGIRNCFKIKKFRYFHIKKLGPLLYSLYANLFLKKNNPDLVYGRDFFGCILSAIRGYNTIFEAHEPLFENGFIYKILLKLLFKQKKFIKMIAISDSLKKIFIENGFDDIEEKFFVAHDAADEVKDFNKLKGWQGRKNTLQVGYFGHLYEGRGINIIVDISAKMPDVDFHIIGGNDKEISYWKENYRDINLFFHGYISPSMVYKYRNNCDILLAPYQEKVTLSNKLDTARFMSPLKIFEYMSSKKAIVCSDLPVLREVLNESNSILVKCDNLSEWINAIERLKNTNLRTEYAQNAYNSFKNQFRWKARAIKVLQ